MHVCHANIGKAVFYTSATIIFGFSILVLSNFLPTIYFGAAHGARDVDRAAGGAHPAAEAHPADQDPSGRGNGDGGRSHAGRMA